MAGLSGIDRRWIFLCVAVALVVTVCWQFRQPIIPSLTVKQVYEDIDRLSEGDVVFIATDFVLRHCFARNIRVIGMTFWGRGRDMANAIFESVAAEYGKQSGIDYVYLGFKPGDFAQVITNMGESLTSAFPADANNRPTANMPIFRDVTSLRDVHYMIDLAAGATVEPWIIYGSDKYGFPMAAGCTAVSGPDYYVYLNTGQLKGLIAGLRGVADYEVLLGKPDMAVRGMPAQSTVHAIIVLFVIVGNAIYFWRRHREKRS